MLGPAVADRIIIKADAGAAVERVVDQIRVEAIDCLRRIERDPFRATHLPAWQQRGGASRRQTGELAGHITERQAGGPGNREKGHREGACAR